jgi:tetratricopeptide (TPR) repeat protein
MEKAQSFFYHLKSSILYLIIFLFPLFFLPLTQEFFLTNKLYLISFGALLLLLISNFQFLISKKLVWQTQPLDKLIVLFLLTVGLATVISSPNKIQAILNPNFGLLALLGLAVLYYYLSRQQVSINFYQFLSISTVFLSISTIFLFFQPFKNVNLPVYLQFLKNASFTPLGSQFDLAIFLGFFVILGFSRILQEQRINTDIKRKIFHFSLPAAGLTFNLLALLLTLYSLLKPNPQLPITNYQLPPFRLSWYAAVETLKNPLTATFGVGIDNFSSLFTRVKDFAYNQTPFWQIGSFSLSRSTLLHIFTETGIFGILAFALVIFSLIKPMLQVTNYKLQEKLVIGYLLLVILFFPPSLPLFFLFFIILTVVGAREGAKTPSNMVSSEFNLSNLITIYLGTIIFSLLLIAGAGYLLGRSYAAEYFFKKSLDGFAQNDAQQVYDNMRQAIILNPYIERFRLNFSQVNLLLANNIAARANQPQEEEKKPYQLTDQDRQNIAQAIQAAIAEAKAAVALNPQKAGHWENLAVIYRNLINAAQGADVWTISAYQRAIVSDPQNPLYRLNLGGTYYSLANYDEAIKLFEQAVALKPDWPNAHYNLAWADFQRENYQRAVAEMQNALTLLNPQKDKADFERAQKDLEEFKKKLPAGEEAATPSGQPSQLTLPTPPAATLEPKIKLPKEASPEAK